MTTAAPLVNIGLVKNVFCRQMHFESIGDVEQGHTHPFDHITLLAKGKLAVTALGVTTEFTAPQMIFIKNGVEHKLEALSDNAVAYCIHVLRDEAGEIISEDMVPKGDVLKEILSRLVS
jgi:quercetin dioxygenase-like cupin family protein